MIRPFGTSSAGQAVDAVDITAGDLVATILTYGATLQDIRLAGVPWPLTLGSDRLSAYEGTMRFFGAVAGPVANRISGASAIIDGQRFDFDPNEGGIQTLHGGRTGSFAQVWTVADHGPDHVTLTLDLPDGTGGFPGNRHLVAEFRLRPPATLDLLLTATTDAPTLMNLTNHSYWNLDGRAETTGQTLTVAADRYTPVDVGLIPTGVAAVDGTAFDLRNGHLLTPVALFDHNFCFADAPRPLTHVAELAGQSGVRLAIATTAPGLQVYDGARMDTSQDIGLTGQPYGPFAGIALETQHWPDAPNQSGFPAIRLDPGQTYRNATEFRFSRSGL